MPRPVRVTDELVRRHQGDLWHHLRFLGASAAVAEDLAQEAFLILVRQQPAIADDRTVGAWLRATGRNLLRQSRRTAREELTAGDDHVLEDAWLRLQGDDDGQRRRRALRRCLEALGGRERTALDLRYRDGASREAMATALELSAEGVKTLLRRARNTLRRCVERRLNDD